MVYRGDDLDTDSDTPPVMPRVRGLTQTGPDAAPMMLQLTDFLAARQGHEADHLANAIAALHQAAKATSNPDVRDKIDAALAVLQLGERPHLDTDDEVIPSRRDERDTNP